MKEMGKIDYFAHCLFLTPGVYIIGKSLDLAGCKLYLLAFGIILVVEAIVIAIKGVEKY